MRTIIKSYTASAAVAAFRIVKFTADTTVAQAAASTDLSIGINGELPAAIGTRLDVCMGGIIDVEYGGTVTRGDKLTSDASGRAITAAPGASVKAQIVGLAQVSGVVGDIGQTLFAPSVFTG